MTVTNVHSSENSFQWVEQRQTSEHISAEQLDSFNKLGYFVIPEAFSVEELSSLLRELDELEQQEEQAVVESSAKRVNDSVSGLVTFVTHAAKRSAAARALLASPLISEVANNLLGPDVRLYWDQAVYKKPHSDHLFPWHQDNGNVHVEPQSYLSLWLALGDAVVDNGCLWVAPGFHRNGMIEHKWHEYGFACFDEDPANAQPVEVKMGSLIVMSSLMPHKSGPNRTDETRKSYVIQLAPGNIRVVHVDKLRNQGEDSFTDENNFFILRDGQPIR